MLIAFMYAVYTNNFILTSGCIEVGLLCCVMLLGVRVGVLLAGCSWG